MKNRIIIIWLKIRHHMRLVTIALDSAILVERAILIPQSPGSSLDQVIHLLCVSKGDALPLWAPLSSTLQQRDSTWWSPRYFLALAFAISMILILASVV